MTTIEGSPLHGEETNAARRKNRRAAFVSMSSISSGPLAPGVVALFAGAVAAPLAALVATLVAALATIGTLRAPRAARTAPLALALGLPVALVERRAQPP